MPNSEHTTVPLGIRNQMVQVCDHIGHGSLPDISVHRSLHV